MLFYIVLIISVVNYSLEIVMNTTVRSFRSFVFSCVSAGL